MCNQYAIRDGPFEFLGGGGGGGGGGGWVIFGETVFFFLLFFFFDNHMNHQSSSIVNMYMHFKLQFHCFSIGLISILHC